MRTVFSTARLQQAAMVFAACIIVGLFVSNWLRVLPSIAMGGLGAIGLLSGWLWPTKVPRALWTVYVPLTLVFFVHLAAGWRVTPDLLGLYRADLLLQLQFLVLPLAWWMLPPLPATYYRGLWLLLIGCTVMAATGALVNYGLHFSQINDLYLQSQVMPTEPDHIRFSLLVTLAAAAAGWLLGDGTIKRLLRATLWFSLVFLVVFQHLLAVRSGLATLYAVAGLGLAWLALKQRNWKAALLAVSVLTGILLLSWKLAPTFINKVTNTQEDMGQVSNQADAHNYSLAARVYSYGAAREIWRGHRLIGVGKVNLADELRSQYAWMYPDLQPEGYILPHNQFLFNLAAYGLLGSLVFWLGIYLPLWASRRWITVLGMSHYLALTLSFLVEYTLETQVGVGYGLFFLLLALHQSWALRTLPPTALLAG